MRRCHRLVLLLVVALGVAACSGGRSFETVDDLYEAAGGEAWCETELQVTLAPYVGSCGDGAGDSRVVLGVSVGGEEIRASVDAARENLVEDDQLLLVVEDPDQAWGWQLRSRDRVLLDEARERLGGVVLDSEDAIDEWLAD